MLKQLKLKGFKCFDDLELELSNLNLLTGVNSSGKSSVIQAILWLLQQKETQANILNGRYIRLGTIEDIKNAVTNAQVIATEVKDESGNEASVSIVRKDKGGSAFVLGRELCKATEFVYLSAERIGVQDVYKQNLTEDDAIGFQGEYAFDYLSRERMNELAEPAFINPDAGVNLGNQVDYWLEYIMGYYVTAERIDGTESVKVSYRKAEGHGKDMKPVHVGTGISYTANVIISALSCKRGSLFIIENPEIHLHPGAQSKLLEFFSYLAARGLQIIVETHSDHIFNGVRKRIKAEDISQEQVKVYFFKQSKEQLSEAVSIEIDNNGVLHTHEQGLFDQFDDDLDELLGL